MLVGVTLPGEMFGQQWENIIDLVTPYPNVPPINVTKALREQNFTALEMFKLAEGFFTSIGLAPMTSDFWEKSIIVRPTSNVSMDCHGSAWDFVADKDFRLVPDRIIGMLRSLELITHLCYIIIMFNIVVQSNFTTLVSKVAYLRFPKGEAIFSLAP